MWYIKNKPYFRITNSYNKPIIMQENKDATSTEKPMPENIDAYIAGFPEAVQERMNLIRKTIHEAAPGACEKISWRMPTFTIKKTLVHFAAFKNHIGFFPGPVAIEVFAEELSAYKTGKEIIQFPHKKPIPTELISRIVGFRVKEIS
ncbi:MAG: DUF1801 domain-containing protein [Tannerellaceae bacterium]|jgi:uncharacterized protein YdhG (YjbR/CyaY superfamily)|nr:DUF1801 domain-containing protein [Tannerellaceae bacterium]